MSGYVSALWYFRFPGTCALGPLRFNRPVTERVARARVREVYTIKRLPSGTEVWPTSDAGIAAVAENNRRIGWHD